MEKIPDQFVLLPFWCLCDDMVSGTGQMQHQHMIVTCELQSSFNDIWKYKIRYEFLNSSRAKKCRKIQDPFLLARTIRPHATRTRDVSYLFMPKMPGHAIPEPKMPRHAIPEPKMPRHAIPSLMPKLLTYVIPDSILVMYPLLEEVSFPRLGKKPVPKSFSTT
ncbi:hypothetical protein NPIL_440181 [Nephila pilipes]|uniref:Uncharacterized protein n=1 Tax=Nephila pilipes TaxID=299642 RepID=A0A8X6QTM8_NEPPI|nr:hypothetical protein NPIL_440181 [Nephila pilipes]